MKKQKPIKPQSPWVINLYSEVQYKGTTEEFDPGYIEFEHKDIKPSIKQEISWLHGKGSFEGKVPPTLIGIWDMLLKHTPGMSRIIYKHWVIEREPLVFVCQLADIQNNEYILKRVLSKFTCSNQDFTDFLDMLDNEEKAFNDNKVVPLDLDKYRKAKEA